MAGVLLKRAPVWIDALAVQGSAPARRIRRRHVQVLFADPISVGTDQSRQDEALAVSSLKRSLTFLNLPTISEEALPGYEAGIWWYLWPAAQPVT